MGDLAAALDCESMSAEALASHTGRPLATVLSRLLELELEGRVARLEGGLYSLVRD